MDTIVVNFILKIFMNFISFKLEIDLKNANLANITQKGQSFKDCEIQNLQDLKFARFKICQISGS